jgi:hypothetical protein
MKTRLALICALIPALSFLAPAAGAQDPPPPEQETLESEITTADKAQVKQLLKAHAAAEKSGDAAKVKNALEAMIPFDNEEFVAPAIDDLRYKASKLDREAGKKEAAELGLRTRKEIAELVLERVVMVQSTAAYLLSNFPENTKATRALVKAFKDKKVEDDTPKVHAAAILALGRMGYRKIERDVFKKFKQYGEPDVRRACVRYFGLIKSRDKSIVRTLCEELAPPEPGNPDDPQNPPASFWAARWKAWSVTRREVTWALKEITGQVFRPQEGDHPGDTKKALDYIKEHAKELGLK